MMTLKFFPKQKTFFLSYTMKKLTGQRELAHTAAMNSDDSSLPLSGFVERTLKSQW